ncbi:hypothetical protein JCM8097_007508 [Rhodosporidiobolus ruineniae]
MRLPLRASSPVRYPTTKLPLLARLAPFLATSLLALLVFSSFLPSPWLSSSFFSVFRQPPAPLDSLSYHSSHTPPVQGCRDPSLTALEARETAAIVLLLRERDLDELLPTLVNFEEQFNGVFRYPYVFISSPDEGALSPSFRRAVEGVLPPNSTVEYAVVPSAHWSIPSHLGDPEAVRRGFAEQEQRGVQYAGREGYHHMCRWYSGLWARHPTLAKYDWFWRLEPGVRFYCPITYDPIRYLALHGKVYGFTISVVENHNTIATLWETVERYMRARGIDPEPRKGGVDEALWGFLTKKDEASGKREFSGCHFWTNFEIGDLRFFRSREYQDFFNYLDDAGGFYHERWGDAPVRALGLGLFAKLDQIHHFSDIAYQHDWFLSCPRRSTSLIPSSASDLLRLQSPNPAQVLVWQQDVVGCRCDCPKEGELQGRAEGRGVVDMGTDWRYSCLEQWEAAVRKSRGFR